jgi:signal transduction histidine kinase
MVVKRKQDRTTVFLFLIPTFHLPDMSVDARPLILVVDDSQSNAHVLSAVLQRDYRVACTLSGEAALEFIRTDAMPALILLDVMMPGMSGYDVMRSLRANVATREIPVVFLTADTSQDAEVAGLELGADDFITKPVILPLLLLRVRNILQRERLKREQVETLQSQLAESAKLEFLGRLVASFAHDIGSPIGNCLTVVTSVAEQLHSVRADFSANSLRRTTIADFLDTGETGMALAQRNLDRALELLNSFKQRALDQATSQARTVVLKDWLDDLLLTLSPAFAKTRHRCVVAVPADLELFTQPGPLGQIVVNLINNALAHAFEGMEAGTIQISARRDADAVALLLADNGIGMAPEVQARAFEPFFTTKAGRGGTGLGLDIVHHIAVDTLGGQLQMHSALGAGTRFEIRLPVALAHVTAAT